MLRDTTPALKAGIVGLVRGAAQVTKIWCTAQLLYCTKCVLQNVLCVTAVVLQGFLLLAHKGYEHCML